MSESTPSIEDLCDNIERQAMLMGVTPGVNVNDPACILKTLVRECSVNKEEGLKVFYAYISSRLLIVTENLTSCIASSKKAHESDELKMAKIVVNALDAYVKHVNAISEKIQQSFDAFMFKFRTLFMAVFPNFVPNGQTMSEIDAAVKTCKINMSQIPMPPRKLFPRGFSRSDYNVLNDCCKSLQKFYTTVLAKEAEIFNLNTRCIDLFAETSNSIYWNYNTHVMKIYTELKCKTWNELSLIVIHNKDSSNSLMFEEFVKILQMNIQSLQDNMCMVHCNLFAGDILGADHCDIFANESVDSNPISPWCRSLHGEILNVLEIAKQNTVLRNSMVSAIAEYDEMLDEWNADKLGSPKAIWESIQISQNALIENANAQKEAPSHSWF